MSIPVSTFRAGRASRSRVRAVERLPATGAAIDLCTGAGAIAKTLSTGRPGARVVASDDRRACRCLRGSERRGGLPRRSVRPAAAHARGTRRRRRRRRAVRADARAGAACRVDTLAFESPLAYDGGHDGTEILRRVLTDSPRFLRRGGALLLELGGEQADALADDLARLGYVDVTVLLDEDDDVRGIEATLEELMTSLETPVASQTTPT